MINTFYRIAGARSARGISLGLVRRVQDSVRCCAELSDAQGPRVWVFTYCCSFSCCPVYCLLVLVVYCCVCFV